MLFIGIFICYFLLFLLKITNRKTWNRGCRYFFEAETMQNTTAGCAEYPQKKRTEKALHGNDLKIRSFAAQENKEAPVPPAARHPKRWVKPERTGNPTLDAP